jgi:hypothetical protein
MPDLSILGEVLASPLGSFTYHFLLLLALEAALGMAWGEWQRARRQDTWRLLLVMVGLTLVRLPYIGAALAATAGWIAPESLLPPLERFADTASIGLLGWAFVSPSGRGGRFWDFLFGANLVMAIGVGAGFASAWNRTMVGNVALDYLAHWQSSVWIVWQLVLIPVTCLAIGLTRREGWGTLLLALCFILLGRLLQLTVGAGIPNLAVWERLANLLAYPLVTVAIYQAIVSDLNARALDKHRLYDASMDELKSLMLLVQTGQRVSDSLVPDTVLANAAQGAARVLGADECAIVLDHGVPGRLHLAALHNPHRQGKAEARDFPLEDQETVQRVLHLKKRVVVSEPRPQLQVLFGLLGSRETGPVLVQPLLVNGEAVGAIIAGKSDSKLPFTPHEAKLCQSLAEQLVSAIRNARRYQSVWDRLEELGSLPANEETLDSNPTMVLEPELSTTRLATTANLGGEAPLHGSGE